MQTRNPILDEFAKLTTGAMGLAQAAGDDFAGQLKNQQGGKRCEHDSSPKKKRRREPRAPLRFSPLWGR